MQSNIQITNHYKHRFRERVAKTSRIEKFANDAYVNGIDSDSVKGKLKDYMKLKERSGREVKYYQKYIHIYNVAPLTAITVFRVPNSSL